MKLPVRSYNSPEFLSALNLIKTCFSTFESYKLLVIKYYLQKLILQNILIYFKSFIIKWPQF